MQNLNKIQKIDMPIINRPDFTTFSLIGDPGCEGLGTVMMQTYAAALQESGADDFILIAGDLVPVGEKSHYKMICELTNTVADKDVFVLRGNHDTGDYNSVFGLYDYAIKGENFTIVVIDNAFRTFSQEGLDLLEEVLKKEECKNVVIAFHIPLPNNFTCNAVSEEEFDRLKAVYSPYKEKVKYFVCGHVHSCFEDKVDGVPFICTGGGGAMIEDVSENIKACDINHHIVRFQMIGEELTHRFVDLKDTSYQKEINDPIARGQIMDTVKGELFAHLQYLTFSERARRRGYEEIANLFEALAESEYRHARSFFAIIDRQQPFEKAIRTFIPGEEFEYQRSYKMMTEYGKNSELPLTEQAYRMAASAEKVHANLLKKAENINEFAMKEIFVCSICGYVMDETNKPERCPLCGAPDREFLQF